MDLKVGDEIEYFKLDRFISSFSSQQIWIASLNDIQLKCQLIIKDNLVKDYALLINQVLEIDDEKYIIKNRLGIGTFGCVHLIINEDDFRVFAMKVYPCKEDGEREYRYYNKLQDCSNIVKMIKPVHIGSHYGILMEKMEMDLYGKGMGFELIMSVAKNVLTALKDIHSKLIVHGDIKLQNILLDRNNIAYICDLSNSYRRGSYVEEIGTIWFRSPENCDPNKMINNKGTNYYVIDYPSDIWGFGICFLSMFNDGKIPEFFKEFNPAQLLKKIGDQLSVDWEIEKIFKKYKSNIEYEFLVSLTKKLLTVDPNMRISSASALEIIYPSEIMEY